MKKNLTPINILHLNDSLDMGGAEIVILNLLKNIDRSRFNPRVGSLKTSGKLNSDFLKSDIPIFEIAQNPGIDIKSIFVLAKYLRINKIKILHTHNFPSWLYGTFASIMAPKCSLFHTQHSNIQLNRNPPLFLRRFLSLFSKKVICVSDQVFNFMLSSGYSEKKKLKVIYNGVNIPKQINKQKPTRKEIHIGIVARLVEVKNHKLLINAFKQLCDKNNNVILDIIGSGPLKAQLHKLAQNMGISHKIIFWGERKNSVELMKDFDIFVLSSFSEGLSISILEAMSNALPVIATAVGGNNKLVQNELNGLLVKSNSLIELKAAMEVLTNQRSKRIQFGKAGYELVKTSFSLEAMVTNYQNTYQSNTYVKD